MGHLQAYTKAGLIKRREDKHSGDVILTGVNRDPQLYSEFKPYKMSSSSAPLAGTSSSTPASAAEGSGDRRGTMTPPVVEEVFKPSREVRRECYGNWRVTTPPQLQLSCSYCFVLDAHWQVISKRCLPEATVCHAPYRKLVPFVSETHRRCTAEATSTPFEVHPLHQPVARTTLLVAGAAV
eukprot:GHUV01030219.1.p1 GENE.GHUV01030219.1~~GHUV01030219.1.p1  ORF type:complete len:181 (-),score=37.62 GHUV01030219.1:870-1412(-)